MYAGAEYQNDAKSAVRHLDALAAKRLTSDRFESLVKTFRQATCLEIGFWEMGLNLES